MSTSNTTQIAIIDELYGDQLNMCQKSVSQTLSLVVKQASIW